jgi:FtsP/CotA-like multicopper oxidase with cupredoxin domain
MNFQLSPIILSEADGKICYLCTIRIFVTLVLLVVLVCASLIWYKIVFAQSTFSEPSEVRSQGGVLRATIIATKQQSQLNGKSFTTMLYNRSLVGPTLRVNPGDRLELKLFNKLDEPTNLHFHGMHVSPSGNADNIFREVGPGETANYVVDIPANHHPGMFWYHAHLHHFSYKQVSDGMSGLIIVNGLENLLPSSLQHINQRTFAMKDFQIEKGPTAASQRTVNGQIDPQTSIASGETQLWHLANIGSETFYNVVLPGHVFHVIAEDGVPVWHVWDANRLLLPSGKRYEVLVTGGAPGSYPLTALSYHQGCVVCPQVTLATINVHGATVLHPLPLLSSLSQVNDLSHVPIAHNRTIVFSSNDEKGIYMINNKTYDPQRVDQYVHLGDVEQWTIKNMDYIDEHPFHIHINDFQVMSVNGKPYNAHGLQDTVPVPVHGEVVIRIPFKDFTGRFVYHCHIRFHGDGGMMGVIQVYK